MELVGGPERRTEWLKIQDLVNSAALSVCLSAPLSTNTYSGPLIKPGRLEPLREAFSSFLLLLLLSVLVVARHA